MHSFELHRGLRTGLRIGALSVALLLDCAGGHAQSGRSKAGSDAAAANAIYSQGIAALQQRDLAGAREAFEKTVKLVPQSPEPHNSLGWVLLVQGETDAAIAEFKAAVQLKPDFAQAHMNFSSALMQKGDTQGAVHEAREAVRLAPQDSETRHILGKVLSNSGDAAGAAAELQRNRDRTEPAGAA